MNIRRAVQLRHLRWCLRVAAVAVLLSFLGLYIAYRVSPYGVRDLLLTVHMRLFDSSVPDFLATVDAMRLSPDQRAALLDLAGRFDRVARASGLNYFVGGGVVIGFVRYGDLVPWDDDFDVYLPRSEQARLEAAFGGNRSTLGLRLIKNADFNYKATLGRASGDRSRLWPYVDVFVYDDFGATIGVPYYRGHSLLKRHVFPVTRVQVGGVTMNFPRCPWSFVRHELGDEKRCCTGKWSHVKEGPGPFPRCLPCAMVRETFPLAEVVPVNSSAVRMLRRGRGRLREMRVHRVGLCGETV